MLKGFLRRRGYGGQGKASSAASRACETAEGNVMEDWEKFEN